MIIQIVVVKLFYCSISPSADRSERFFSHQIEEKLDGKFSVAHTVYKTNSYCRLCNYIHGARNEQLF